jgi:hypothetical protein
VAEQDHQFGGAKKIERKCCLQVTCQRTHTKTGQYFAFWPSLAWLITQPLGGRRLQRVAAAAHGAAAAAAAAAEQQQHSSGAIAASS